MRKQTLLFLSVLLASGAEAPAQIQHVHQPSISPPAQAEGVAALTAPANESRLPNRVEVSLRAAPARLTLQGGVETDVFAYNGQIPGPTLEFREGDEVIVRFRNDLPVPTTVHWHGLHLPFDADGSPFHPVDPGEEREYRYTVRPGTAGTYWYHPHPHHDTGAQVARGLYGAVIVRAIMIREPRSRVDCTGR